MQICKCFMERCSSAFAKICSDGTTPEEKTKQILAVAPILKGQTASQNTKAASPEKAQPAPQSSSQSQPQQQPSSSNDLIDFGQSDSLPASSVPERNSSLQQQTTQQPTNVPSRLQEPLMPGQPLRRVDTETKDLDEFVDAPGSN